jgi:Universal stress protein family
MAAIVDSSHRETAQTGLNPTRAMPVVLATLSVRVEPSAEQMAIDSAREAGVRLIVANMLDLPPYPLTVMLAPQYATLPHEEDLEEVRATATRAAAQGVPTELLRVSSRRPIVALLELIGELDAGLLVFGPDRSRLTRRRFRAAERAVRRKASCLVWTASDFRLPPGPES